MPNVLQFRPRKPSAPMSSTAVLEGSALRAEIEQAAQAALDQADRLIALLDQMEGEAVVATAVPAAEIPAPQILWLRGKDSSPEANTVETRP